MLSKAEFIKILPTITDISCVKANHTMSDIERMVLVAAQYHTAAVFALPAMTEFLCKCCKGTSIVVGGTVGFPSGTETTHIKAQIAEQLLKFGCGELDMVLNQTYLKSGMLQSVYKDIRSIVEIDPSIPVKVILEVNNLTSQEIVTGCSIAEQAGAKFVKSGSGWHKMPTSLEHIKLMRASVSDNVKVKAAGGVRDVDTAYQMYMAGCSRFGLGLDSFLTMINK